MLFFTIFCVKQIPSRFTHARHLPAGSQYGFFKKQLFPDLLQQALDVRLGGDQTLLV
jgi:hypothetical protein